MKTLTPREISLLRRLVAEESGNQIAEDRIQMMVVRLKDFARGRTSSVEDVLSAVVENKDKLLRERVVEALINGETYFFRDPALFLALREKILPQLLGQLPGGARLVIWSAACSTGQEPYSMSMLVDDAFPELAEERVAILATDLSLARLDVAKRAVYQQFDINRGLPARYLLKYFEQWGDTWQVRQGMRERVMFQRANLLDALPVIGRADIVLLRNVLIYFEDAQRRSVLEKVASKMNRGGALVLGSSEMIRELDEFFVRDPVAPGLFRRL